MINLNTEQKIKLTVVPKTASGKVTQIDGQPLWSSSNLAVISLETSPDGFSTYAIAAGAGTATVSVLADANLGSGTREVRKSVDLTVTNAEAASLDLIEGPVENQ